MRNSRKFGLTLRYLAWKARNEELSGLLILQGLFILLLRHRELEFQLLKIRLKSPKISSTYLLSTKFVLLVYNAGRNVIVFKRDKRKASKFLYKRLQRLKRFGLTRRLILHHSAFLEVSKLAEVLFEML